MMITVELAFATPTRQQLTSLEVEQGTRARELVIDAVARALIQLQDTPDTSATVPIGIFGEVVDDEYLLNDGDRLEIYRPLQQDPKELRRKRASSYKDSVKPER